MEENQLEKMIEIKDFIDQCKADNLLGAGLEGQVYDVKIRG